MSKQSLLKALQSTEAFNTYFAEERVQTIINDIRSISDSQVTLRDQFAMAALTGNLAYSHVSPVSGNYQENCTVNQLSEYCYKLADAMLEARKENSDGV